jgi:hypothetical protein
MLDLFQHPATSLPAVRRECTERGCGNRWPEERLGLKSECSRHKRVGKEARVNEIAKVTPEARPCPQSSQELRYELGRPVRRHPG